MEKGSIWVLEVTDGEVDGRPLRPPPDVELRLHRSFTVSSPPDGRSRGDPTTVVGMRILVTNDDGVDSPGIHALAAALVADGHDVLVVAPTDDRSGAGASIGRLLRQRSPAGRTPRVGRAPRPLRARDRRAAGDRGVRRVPRRVRRPPRPRSPRASTPVPTPVTSCCTRAPSAPRSPRPGYGIPGIAVSMEWSEDRRVPLGRLRRASPRPRSSGRPSPTATRGSSTSTCPNRPLDELLGVREAELAPAGEVWVASADVSSGDLKIEIKGRADPAPGTDVAARARGLRVGHPVDEHRAQPGHRCGAVDRRRARLTRESNVR